MKIHFDKKEKELVNSLVDKLVGQKLLFEDLRGSLKEILGSSNFKIKTNYDDDIRYTHILYYKDIEIGLDLVPYDGEYFKVKDTLWYEF